MRNGTILVLVGDYQSRPLMPFLVLPKSNLESTDFYLNFCDQPWNLVGEGGILTFIFILTALQSQLRECIGDEYE